MPNINNILAQGSAIGDTDRAIDAWRNIQDKPTEITLVRNKVVQTAQTVRIEWGTSQGSNETMGAGGASSVRYGVVFGVKGHPTVADTSIRRDDRFAVNGYQYRVLDVLTTIGSVQARFEVMS